MWLHQEGEKITWHENFAHAGFFRDFNTAKRVAETHLLETFGAIGFYKIVGFLQMKKLRTRKYSLS